MCLPIPPLGNILVGEVGLEPTTTRVSDEYSKPSELFPYRRLSIRQAYWLLRWDSNPRSSGYEPDEITPSPLSDIGWVCKIRTRNLLDPNQGFYQIELTPNICFYKHHTNFLEPYRYSRIISMLPIKNR